MTILAKGRALYYTRAAYMVDTNQGLTQTYNALKDPGNHHPRILALRLIHEEMDRAVLGTYGWGDIPVTPYIDPLPDTVIDRLYELNEAQT